MKTSFKKHLLESPNSMKADIEKIALQIETDASDAVQAIRTSGKLLYRGITHTGSFANNVFGVKQIRQDRRPVEMKQTFHTGYHELFKELGLKATRSNGIFCTCNRLAAKKWGFPSIALPKNGWSATVFDRVKRGYVYLDIADLDPLSPEAKETLVSLQPRNIETPGDLAKVLKEQYNDIIITGKEYYYIGVDIPNLTSFGKGLIERLFPGVSI